MKVLLSFILFLSFLAEAKNLNLNDIYFNVYRNGSKIGYHKIDFNNDNNSTNPYVEIKFEVTFLGFTVYDYFHQNNENWVDNSLVKLKTKTDKNGEDLFCNVNKIDNATSLDGTNNKEDIYENILPTSYWNYKLVEDKKNKKVLNTQDCSFIDFKIEYLGEEWTKENIGFEFSRKTYIQNLLSKFEDLFGTTFRKFNTPMATDYHPEADDSLLLNDEDAFKCRSIIGSQNWVVILGRFDVHSATNALRRFGMAPSEGHFKASKRVSSSTISESDV